MARIVTVSVGPLAGASVNQVVQTQKVAGATFMVLNGASGVSVANNIATTQSVGSATTVVLNGTLAQTIGGVTVANIAGSLSNQFIFITSAANDSGITFTVVGQKIIPGGTIGVTEVITGANASTVSSVNQYSQINSITTSGATSGNITVGTYGTATLDKARQLLFTDAGNDSGITATITGTDINGTLISETLTLANASTVTSVLDYASVISIKTSGAVATTIQVGTNGVAHSAWVRFDEYSGMGPTSIQVDGTGTINWTVQQSVNDPLSFGSPYTISTMNWVQHPDTNLQGSAITTGVQGNYAYPPIYARLQLNSGTGTARATFTQSYMK